MGSLEKEILIKLIRNKSICKKEGSICDFLFSYLKNKGLYAKKQHVINGRYNLVIGDPKRANILFCCHIDTVPPSSGWRTDPFNAKIANGRIYGLGACDMKGPIASLLAALIELRKEGQKIENIAVLFDVGEETDFAGMKKFIESTPKLGAKLAVFTEPTSFEIINKHRGLIEINVRIKGKSAHSASGRGINAITTAIDLVKALEKRLEKERNIALGETTCNLSYITGGVLYDSKIKNQPNMVPDTADITLDIRPSTTLRAKGVLSILKKEIKKKGGHISNIDIIHDYSALYIDEKNLSSIKDIILKQSISSVFGNLKGYGEGQMLNQKFGVNCIYLGPGDMGLAHKSNENILLRDLNKGKLVYKEIIESYRNL